MVMGRKELSSENLPYFMLLLSLLRPELQGYIKPDHASVVPDLAATTNPYNLTGLAFNGHGSPFGTSPNINNFISSKEVTAAGLNYDGLSQYLNWQPTAAAHFNNSAVTMILGEETNARLPLMSMDSESGYSSDGARSPLSTYSYGSTSPAHSGGTLFQAQDNPLLEDLSELGAAGFTPTDPSLVELLNTLDDYMYVDQLMEPAKGTVDPVLSQFDLVDIKQEPDLTITKLNPDISYLPEFISKTPLDDIDFRAPLDLEIGNKFFDPYSIDFISGTNSSLQFPPGNDVESAIDFDSLISLDYDLPPEIFNPEELSAGLGTNLAKNDSELPVNGDSIVSSANSINRASNLPPVNGGIRSDQGGANTGAALKRSVATIAVKASSAKKLYGAKSKTLDLNVLEFGVSDERLVDMPVSEFNTLLEKLTDVQMQYAKEVRRRGKNKEAARVCRKRKFGAIEDLDEEIIQLKSQKQKIIDERKKLWAETAELKSKIGDLESYVFNSLRDDSGLSLSPVEYSLFQGSNGAVFVGKNIAAEEEEKNGSS